MTNKEQIFAYKELRNNGQAFFIDNYEDADRIIEALEKQIPKEPFETYDDDTCLYKHFECSVCGVRLSRHSSSRYCMTCGQKIGWEGVKE